PSWPPCCAWPRSRSASAGSSVIRWCHPWKRSWSWRGPQKPTRSSSRRSGENAAGRPSRRTLPAGPPTGGCASPRRPPPVNIRPAVWREVLLHDGLPVGVVPQRAELIDLRQAQVGDFAVEDDVIGAGGGHELDVGQRAPGQVAQLFADRVARRRQDADLVLGSGAGTAKVGCGFLKGGFQILLGLVLIGVMLQIHVGHAGPG